MGWGVLISVTRLGAACGCGVFLGCVFLHFEILKALKALFLHFKVLKY